MSLDIRQVAENLIQSLWGESDKLRYQAEGVRLLFLTLIKEGEKLNEIGQQSPDPGAAETEKKQAE
jgi:hypothetical protein